MNKLLLIAVISSVLVMGMLVDNTTAQAPPEIKVSLALAGSLPDVPNRLVYRTVDPIRIVLTLKYDGLQEIKTSKGFAARKFYLFLTFIDPDGKGIIAKYFENVEAKDPPPPEVKPLDGTLPQVEPVEILPANWAPLPYVLPNAHAYYRLTKPGDYSVKAIIHMGTFPEVFYTDPQTGEKYAKIDNPLNWAGDLLSNTVHFTLLADADKDGYYYPEGYPPGALADCNDNDPKEKPGQTWYKDEDNDGYSDGTTNTTSCTRPSGYKTELELAGTAVDCDDNNPLRSPGITEVACNGVDDDCNPTTSDVPAPTLASPANGATNVSVTPTFTWSTVSCATSYGLQVATTESFSPPSTVVIDQSVTTPSFTVSTPPLSNNTTYYWHVNAKKSGEISYWSSVRSFTTVATVPAAPTLDSPANNATGISLTPTLSWNASSGATSYGLQVSTSPTTWTGSYLKINQSGINGISYTVPSGKLSNNTTYYWRVNGTNAAGPSAWSSPWRFTTTTGKTSLLTVKKAGTGSGNVSASPPEPPLIWNGNIGTATYEAGTKVTLTATANAGSTFTGWSASCSGSGNCSVVIKGSTCTVNMCGPCKATATFRKK